MLQINKPPPQLQQINSSDNFDTRFNNLMQNRNLPLNIQVTENKNTPLRNKNDELDNPEFLDTYQNLETNIEDLKHEKAEPIDETPITTEKKQK